VYLKSLIEQWLYEDSIESSNQVLNQVSELIDKSLITDMKEEVTFLASLDLIKNANHNLNNYTDYNSDTFKYLENDTEKSIEDYFHALKDSHKSTNFIFLGTENGGYMEYPRFTPSDGYDPRVRPWYIDAINHEGITISDPYITKISNEMVVSFTKRIENKGAVIGVVGISVKLDEITTSINKIKIGETGYLLVMSPKHRFLVSPNNPDWIMKTPHELGLDLFDQLETENKIAFEAELDGVKRVFNCAFSADSGLHIVSVVNKNEILLKAKEITNILIVIYAFTFVVIFTVVYLISKHITKPILKLSSVINRMTDFDFNFDNNTNIESYRKRTDEIGVVGTALIEMHDNFSELMTQVNCLDEEIKNIDIETNNQLKLKLSKNNPFSGVIGSMNSLLDKIYLYFDKLKTTNSEIIEKNELLTSSEEELMAQLEEIDQQKEYINFLAFHDSLTGLPNRRRFIEYLTDQLKSGKKGAVVLLDLDDFKGINDTRGHVFGDHVLEAVAKRLESVVTDKVFISRFGGDEFLMSLEYSELVELDYCVKRISHLFDNSIQIYNNDIEIRFSMGISLFPEDSSEVNQLVINADLAMYAVKNSGKNGFKLFDTAMMLDQMKKSNIEQIIRGALDNDGFKMVYQPQVDVETGEIYGYEALLRLKGSNLSPADFIDIAEKNGTIIKIGRIVTEKVIAQLSEWKRAGLEIKPVAINFSANQLQDGNYILFLNELLRKNAIDAKYLEIEITENIFLENKQATLIFLKQLNEMGVKIAIDDFGTGYSSLNYLTFLPVNIIKLDRSLNMKFLEIENVKVMDSLISLVHSLGLTVIAEGIETPEQVKRLKKANCDYIQGYYFSKPLEADQIPTIHTTVYNNM
jgi:diguanylate cyclase (GGDEF)-like protein